MINAMDVSALRWADINFVSYQNLFDRYEQQYAQLWMQLPSLENNEAAMGKYFDKYAKTLNSAENSVNALTNSIESRLNGTMDAVSRLPSVSGVSQVSGVGGLSGVSFGNNGTGNKPNTGSSMNLGLDNMNLNMGNMGLDMGDMGLDMGDMGLNMGNNTNGQPRNVNNLSPLGPSDLTSIFGPNYTSILRGMNFKTVNLSVEYPSQYHFKLFLPSQPNLSLSFSVGTMFGYLRKEYTFVVQNLYNLVHRGSHYYVVAEGKKEHRVSEIIIDLLKFRYKKMFSYIGHIQYAGPADIGMRFPIEWRALNKQNKSVYQFSVHSFNYEFDYLVKYFVTHMSTIQYRNSQLGFYNWFNHWVVISNSSIVRYFMQIWKVVSSSTIVTTTHIVKPVVSKTVHLFTSSGNGHHHGKKGIWHSHGPIRLSRSFSNFFNDSNMNNVMKKMHKHIKGMVHHGGLHSGVVNLGEGNTSFSNVVSTHVSPSTSHVVKQVYLGSNNSQ
jgi:hypothetical protein